MTATIWQGEPAVSHSVVRLLLTVEEAAAALAVCRRTVYKLLDGGHVESVYIGRSRRIPLAALEDYVSRLHASDAAGARHRVLGQGVATA